jgi:ADP-ribose pyrophosphatase
MEETLTKNEIIDRKIVHDGYCKIEEITIKNGEETVKKEVLKMNNGVGAVIKDTVKNKYIFVSQYRAGVEGMMLEIVAGKIDDGEKPEEAMKREIMEETGYKVDYINHLKDFYTCPSKLNEIISVFYVEVSEKVNEGGGVNGENIDVVEVEMLGLGGRLFFKDPHNMDMEIGKEEKIMPPYQLIDAKSLIAVMEIENNNTLKNMSEVITNAKLRSL